ncbi:hypothetical protein QFX18_09995 [Saccharophagus degradans]|uniref:hypothetical protein n=1 Tax=Saccharophagus degradans TaxID=86304 RepID=UPI00247822A0|nr:hypothetical protein [Saccharophagus degradans]WGP00378.1 hypothetical protein QFX18_09995 [Saccharophagus degradans]
MTKVAKGVTIFLCGGVGNNLFQLALGKHLERKYGVIVTYNTFLTQKNFVTQRLLGWTIHSKGLSDTFFGSEKVEDRISILGFLCLLLNFVRGRIFGDKYLVYSEEQDKALPQYLFGYWQVGPHLNVEVVELLAAKITHAVVSENSLGGVLMHVRRGDFGPGRRLGHEYYGRALDSLGVSSGMSVKIIAENYEAARDLIDTLGDRFVMSADDASNMQEDFISMLNSDVLICSNSTFCYWAGVLGRAKLLICPDHIDMTHRWQFAIPNKKAKFIESEYY